MYINQKISPLPLFAKEGYKTSLWQREVRRDFINTVIPIMSLLVSILGRFGVDSIG